MRIWAGKLLGAFFGFLVGGPVGAFFGLLVGHQLDRGVKMRTGRAAGGGANPFSMKSIRAQQVFFKTTFSVMGYLCKADGHVSANEINWARTVMSRMRLNEMMKKQAINFFNHGKTANFNLQETLTTFQEACGENRILFKQFLEIQVQTGYLQGKVDEKVKHLLQSMCHQLGYTLQDFDYIFSQRSKRSSSSRQQTSSHDLRHAYAKLNVPMSAEKPEIKIAYKRLMSKYHPDKLIAKGASEAKIKLATEKTQQISAAYDQVMAAL